MIVHLINFFPWVYFSFTLFRLEQVIHVKPSLAPCAIKMVGSFVCQLLLLVLGSQAIINVPPCGNLFVDQYDLPAHSKYNQVSRQLMSMYSNMLHGY